MAGAVCNNAQIVGGQLLGQPTDGAILAAAIKVTTLSPSLFVPAAVVVVVVSGLNVAVVLLLLLGV